MLFGFLNHDFQMISFDINYSKFIKLTKLNPPMKTFTVIQLNKKSRMLICKHDLFALVFDRAATF